MLSVAIVHRVRPIDTHPNHVVPAAAALGGQPETRAARLRTPLTFWPTAPISAGDEYEKGNYRTQNN